MGGQGLAEEETVYDSGGFAMSVNSVVKHCVMPKDMYLAKMWKSENVVIGTSTYQIVVSPASKKNGAVQFHVAALKDGEVVTFKDLNSNLYDITIRKYIDELTERLSNVMESQVRWIHTGNHDIYISYGGIEQWTEEDSPADTGIRLILMVKNVENMDAQEETTLRKILKGDLVEWMETVIMDKPAIQKTKEDYANDLVRVADISMIPHEKSSFDSVPIMTVLALLFSTLGVFFSQYLVFQVIGMVVAAYTAYRAYQKGAREIAIINGICCLISIYFVYYGYVNA
ncbi:MAG: hypothetical protein IJL03_11100 [Lachnospiraceae bacterium]|nr:hypothetical protein [Lachnospiraceae bacterium]